MFCKYCKTYHESEEKGKTGNYCFSTHKIKDENDAACDVFVLNHFFYCKIYNRRQDMVVCLHIQRKLAEESEKHKILYADCIRCRQKEDIIELHRGVKTGKPTLIKRQEKVAPEPIIERKKSILIPKQKPELIPKQPLLLKRKPMLVKRKEN